MTEDWEKIEAKKALKIMEEINPHIDPVPFNIETTAVRISKLPFYKDYNFYELTDLSVVPGVKKYAIYKAGDVHVINWTNQTIYDVNEKAPIDINEKTLASYVNFFFSYVRGRHGRFLITQSVDDIQWQSEPPPQGRKVIEEMIKPISLKGQDDDGTYNLEAYMIFKDSLFKTEIHVAPDGAVSLSNEELKIEGMPVAPDGVHV